jgi:hypothetical protein
MSTPTEPVNGGGLVPAGAPAAGVIKRQEFGAESLTTMAETSTSALAAREKAMVEARFIMAMRRPRDWDDVRAKLLRACERPGFAGSAEEKVWGAAWYRKPVGEGVEGFSVRFAEEAMRAMGNIDVLPSTVYEDERKRIVTVMVLDLETNNSVTTTITIEKTVERKFLKKGEVPIRSRPNSSGQMVHILQATDDDVFSKQQNLVSKARRTGILQLLPGDIQAECRTRILAIRNGEAAKDPDKLKRQLADGFAALNVPPSQLKEYLGHELALSTPAELADLRELWEGLKEGKTTWAAVLEEVRAERGVETAAGGDPEKPKEGLGGVTERLKSAAPAKPATAPAAAAASTTKTCAHDKVKGLGPGQEAPCPDCGEILTGGAAPGNISDEAWEAAHCKNHGPTMTVVLPDGSKACDAQGCTWTSPAPTTTKAATSTVSPFRDPKKAPPAKPSGQGRLSEE